MWRYATRSARALCQRTKNRHIHIEDSRLRKDSQRSAPAEKKMAREQLSEGVSARVHILAENSLKERSAAVKGACMMGCDADRVCRVGM